MKYLLEGFYRIGEGMSRILGGFDRIDTDSKFRDFTPFIFEDEGLKADRLALQKDWGNIGNDFDQVIQRGKHDRSQS